MKALIYNDLASWYRLLDPLEDHLDECAVFAEALSEAVRGEARSLLELGSGAGHNAHFLKDRFRCTLSDISAPMLELSRELNPECEHLEGDMRSVRIARQFDAILVHDAVVYMSSEPDVRALAETIWTHLRPGGAAIVAPDFLEESFREYHEIDANADGDRAMRVMTWVWDRDPHDARCEVEYAFLLREGQQVRAVHDHHREGLFARATWTALLSAVGLEVAVIGRPIDHGPGAPPYSPQVFLARRPATA